ncbi:MAG: class I SAM-dependent methyltransferase [Acidobacteriia bacterium]|nr:class I SAM-dependent methyltransferase [Terriglobia bacterium]
MQNEWYRSFFQGIALDMWRHAITPEMTEADVSFLETSLQVPPGGRVLDVACGLGRHSIALTRRGYALTGVDLSEESIAEARGLAAGLPAEFLLGDMRELPGPALFDGAFCFGNSFGYLEHDGNRAMLASVAHALRPKARFVLETGIAAESILPTLKDRFWAQMGDILFLAARRYNALESCLEIEYSFLRGGVQETRPAVSRIYTVAEIRRMCEEAGLATVSIHGSLDGGPYQLGSPRLLLVAEKEA